MTRKNNTKSTGNKAESVILSEFVKHNIPVLLPFGDNEKYDLVIDLEGKFYSVQVKNGLFKKDKIRHIINPFLLRKAAQLGRSRFFSFPATTNTMDWTSTLRSAVCVRLVTDLASLGWSKPVLCLAACASSVARYGRTLTRLHPTRHSMARSLSGNS